MKEVYPGIFLIKEKGRFGVFKPPENVYVIPGENGLIFDAGYGTKKAINHLIREIENLRRTYPKRDDNFKLRVLPSHAHPDHISGIARLRKRLGIKIILTKMMAQVIQSKKDYYDYYESEDYYEDLMIPNGFWQKIKSGFRHKVIKIFYRNIYGLAFLKDPDIIIDDDSSIEINGEEWKILSTPGHCITHISLYNEEKGILFAGDNVLRTITTWLGPPTSSIKAYIKTIESYQKLPNLKIILPSHGSPIKNPDIRLKEILEHRKSRTNQVLSVIRENKNNGITPDEIIQRLYPTDSRMKQGVARGWICLTLKMLERSGEIERKNRDKGNKVNFIAKK
ncbi:MAG: MBL fold metallo-hydrolase [Candidatus Lokiarchaeota archaeon]